MKNNYFLFSALALALASCSHTDEPGQLTEHSPASFTAQIGQTVSRAAGTDWFAGDAIGISGISGAKTYRNVKFVTASGDGNFTSEGDNIYYQTTDPVTFTAYYPYATNLADDGIISASTADQTQQPAFDFLWTQASGNYAAPAVNFIFTHRMSKINIAFTNGNDVDLSDLTFSIDGLVLDGTFDTATGEAKAAEDGSAASLTAALSTDSKASLIVFPQSADKLTVTATTEGQQYSCALSPGVLAAGNAYTFNIAVKKNGMTVTGSTITDWTAGGEFNGDATMPVPKIGDFFYSDGTYSTALDASKTCIGIVFHIGHHENDGSDYSSTGIGRTQCHGYVVALTDVHNDNNDRLCWENGPNNEHNQVVGSSTDNVDWNGYSNNLKFHEFVNKETNKATGWEMKHFPAVLACETYGNRTLDQNGNPANGKYDWQKPLAAPQNTSGWFLPSCGQMKCLYQNRSVLSVCMDVVKNSVPADCSYKGYIKWFSTSWYYWSSTEYPDLSSYVYMYGYNDLAYYNRKDDTLDVRAVLAF